jgi:hypothetical protein
MPPGRPFNSPDGSPSKNAILGGLGPTPASISVPAGAIPENPLFFSD